MSAKAPARFSAVVRRAAVAAGQAPWPFIRLPQAVSDSLPRRGRVTVEGRMGDHVIRGTAEPDGQRGHWLKLDAAWLTAAAVQPGDTAPFTLAPVAQEPEPDLPPEFAQALANHPQAQATWQATTTLARIDWIHWLTSAKQAATRAKRVRDACDMLAAGHKRVCCFDPSGFYSKACAAPQETPSR